MVSVIVPNFNHEAFLEERMDSIFAQTFDDYEVIILDDKSTDGSREVIERYRENRKVSAIIYNEENSGSPFRQWRKGMELASGDYIWIAESDDSCKPCFLERLVHALESDPGCVLSYCGSEIIDEKGNSSGLHPNLKGMGALEVPGEEFNRKYMSRRNVVVNASSAVFRKSAALRVDNGYDGFGGYGDYVFWIGLARQGSVVYTPEMLNLFRFHTSSTTVRTGCSLKGVRESLLADKYLYEEGLVSAIHCFRRKVDLIYRLEYILKDVPESQKVAVEEMAGVGFACHLGVRIKHIKRHLFDGE